ncbi:hypothetical protein B4U80_12096, partial [Leptotrombidium deliense]
MSALELDEYSEKKLAVDYICNVHNNIEIARKKLSNDKEDIKREEARLAAKNAFESEFLKAKQLIKKRKTDLISDDAVKLENSIDKTNNWLCKSGDVITEAQFKERASTVLQMVIEINACFERAEKKKTEMTKYITSLVQKCDEKINDIERHTKLDFSLKNRISNIKQFLSKGIQNSMDVFNDTFTESIKVYNSVNNILQKVIETRNDKRISILQDVQKMIDQSPLLSYQDVFSFLNYESKLQQQLRSFQLILKDTENLSKIEMEQKFAAINDKINEYKISLTKERNQRTELMYKINGYLMKCKKVIEDNKSNLLSGDEVNEIQEIVIANENWSQNLQLMPTEEIESKCEALAMKFSEFEIERERRRIYSKIQYGAEHFWEYISPEAKEDLKETQRKIIETKLASILF